jgi:hypothetical protein
MQQTKGVPFLADNTAAATVAEHLRVCLASDGFLVAGTLVGTPAFQATLGRHLC